MIPVSVSSATMARVAQAMGQEDARLARARGFLGLSCSLVLVLPSILVILTMPQWVAGLYTPEISVIQAAIPLLFAVAFLQLFDATYITAQGALRGLKDVNGPLLISLSFWVFGLPAAWWLGIEMGQGAVGLWWGMVTGIAVTAVLLVWRFHWRSERTIREAAA
jgi:MATE family multidrug resistance protein